MWLGSDLEGLAFKVDRAKKDGEDYTLKKYPTSVYFPRLIFIFVLLKSKNIKKLWLTIF
jgi:hypothetical protein